MLTQAYLKELLFYDPETGTFSWIVQRQRVKPGMMAGTVMKDYICIEIDGEPYKAHQLAWLYVYGEFVLNLDHKNRTKNDNRIDNLRKSSEAENRWNRPVQSNNVSGYKGVSWNKAAKKYTAYIQANNKSKCLGYFSKPELAAEAYRIAAKELHGEFANG